MLGHRPRLLEGRGRDLSDIDDPPPRDPRLPATSSAAATPNYKTPIGCSTGASAPAGTYPSSSSATDDGSPRFRRHSRHAPSVAGVAHRTRAGGPPVEELAERALTRWHHDRQGQTVAALQQADSLDQITWGIVATWHAVATRAAERIWVEHDFAHSGRIVPGVDGVETTTDPAEPGTVDDLVDSLIAKASQQGIPVDLLDKGTLRPRRAHRGQDPIAKSKLAVGPESPDHHLTMMAVPPIAAGLGAAISFAIAAVLATGGNPGDQAQTRL